MKTWGELSTFQRVMAALSAFLAVGGALFVFFWGRPFPNLHPKPVQSPSIPSRMGAIFPRVAQRQSDDLKAS